MSNPISPHGAKGPLRQNAVLLSILSALGLGYAYFRFSAVEARTGTSNPNKPVTESMLQGYGNDSNNSGSGGVMQGIKDNVAKGGSTGSVGSTGAADSKRGESLRVTKD